MAQLNLADANKLSPDQATELIHILGLQARWESHCDDPAKNAATFSDLQARQKAHDAFHTALRGYATKYHTTRFPELTQAMPDRLAIWCRALRVVFSRASAGAAQEVMSKVYRLADRIATRTGQELIGRTPATDLAAAVSGLDAVIAWCDGMMPPASPAGLA